MRLSSFLLSAIGILAPTLIQAQNVCFQEVVGSSGSYADISAALDTWATKAYTELGLTGQRQLSIGWAQIPDRVSFENGCDGPYTSMADLFVTIDPANTNGDDYASIQSKLEAFIAANPLTSNSAITCSARSVTTEIPICQAPSTPTGPSGPQPGEEGTVCYQEIVGTLSGSYADIDAAFKLWADKAYAELGLTGERDVSINWAQVPDRNSFENGCDGPYTAVADLFVHIDTNSLSNDDYASLSAKLEAFIAANPISSYSAISCSARSVTDFIPICGIPTTPTGPSTPQGSEGTVCYQTIVGSMSSYEAVSAAFDDWASKAYTALGVTGEREVSFGWARVPDRVSFENGCDGPYPTVADFFVHIDTSKNSAASETYESLKAKLETFIAANPFSAYPAITCSARSVTDFIPICGLNPAMPTEAPGGSATQAPEVTQAPTSSPATEAPATEAPATEAPATQAPATEAPATQAPATEAPATQAPATEAPATEAPTSTPTGGAGPQPGEEGTVCYQAIVGSSASYADVSAALDTWANKAYTDLGLVGERNQYVNWAQVPDRTSFENGCDGPYATVVDVFVTIDTNLLPSDDFTSLTDKIEALIAGNPFTGSVITCAARSVTDFIPVCGINPATPTLAPGGSATQAPAATEAPAPAVTQAPATQAPATEAPATPAPTSPPAGETPTPENVVCYQEIVGSLTGSYADIDAALKLWAAKAYTELGLTGPQEVSIGWAQVPDRNSFENGCNGPYTAVADLFVHIQTTADEYDALAAKLETFIAANPLTGYSAISCMARSVVLYLPTCGKIETPPTTFPASPQPGDEGTVCYQEIVGSLSGSYADIDAAFKLWADKAYTTLGLTGERDVSINWAQVPDRNSFENGCNGPYATVADLFVHIDSSTLSGDDFRSLSDKLESFIAANPLTSYSAISCSARSVIEGLPICGVGKSNPTAAPGGNAPAPAAACPSTTFTSQITRQGDGAAAGTAIYAINFNPSSTVTWADVHISTSTGSYNYRMQAGATGFTQIFPSYLQLPAGQTISYSYTYWTTAANYACDSPATTYVTV